MKTMFAFMSFVFVAAFASAYEIPENPDRYPSMALSGLTGDSAFNGQNKTSLQEFGVSLRFPLSYEATFDIGYATQRNEVTAASVSQNFSGNFYSASVRVYFVPRKPEPK